VKETVLFPSGAGFRFVLFQFEPRWGFRAALQKYYDIFPEVIRQESSEGRHLDALHGHCPGAGLAGFPVSPSEERGVPECAVRRHERHCQFCLRGADELLDPLAGRRAP